MSRKPTTPAEMRAEAARLREYAARLDRQSERASANAPGSFVTGRSGRTAAQNKRSERALELTITNAGKSLAATKEANRLERHADFIESGGPERVQAEQQKRKAVEMAADKAIKAAKKALPLEDRLLVCGLGAAYVFCDRAVERHGDYRRLATMSYDSMQLQIKDDCPKAWRPVVEARALAMAEALRKEREANV